MPKSYFKYGGVGFRTKASPTKINRFIRELPEKKRQSLFQVAEELKSSGMIELTGNNISHSHIDNLYIDD